MGRFANAHGISLNAPSAHYCIQLAASSKALGGTALNAKAA